MSALFIPSDTQLANALNTNSKLTTQQTATAQQMVRCTARRVAIGAIAFTIFSLLTAIATRQIVYTVAPRIVEYITTEAIKSSLPR